MRCHSVALIFLLLTSQAYADTSISILGIEPIAVPGELAQELTDSLRKRAATTLGVRLVPSKDLIEIKLIFGCDGEAPSCLAQAGRSLGVEKLIYGSIRKLPGGRNNQSVAISLRTLDVSTGSIEKQVADRMLKRELIANLTPLSTKWFGALHERALTPTLVVSSNPPEAEIAIDGQVVGRTPTTLQDLTPGVHTVTLTMNGRIATTRTVELRRGVKQDLDISLEPDKRAQAAKVNESPPLTAEPATTALEPSNGAHPGRGGIAAGSALLISAAVFGAVGIYGYVHYSSDLANEAGKFPPGAQYDSLVKEGNRWADITTAMGVTCGVLAGAGAIALAVGIYQKHSSHKQTRAQARILPTFSPLGGGLSALGSF